MHWENRLVFGFWVELARKRKMISGNIKLSGSTVVIPCKRPVSQLFRTFYWIRIQLLNGTSTLRCAIGVVCINGWLTEDLSILMDNIICTEILRFCLVGRYPHSPPPPPPPLEEVLALCQYFVSPVCKSFRLTSKIDAHTSCYYFAWQIRNRWLCSLTRLRICQERKFKWKNKWAGGSNRRPHHHYSNALTTRLPTTGAGKSLLFMY